MEFCFKRAYDAPNVENTNYEYDCLIAQSSLENLGSGDEWVWED